MGRQALDDRQPGGGKLLLETVDQRQRQLTADAGRQPDGDPADRLVAAGAQILARMRHQLQNRDAVVEQPLAGVGQRDAAAVAQEQLLAQFGLEAAHLAAERGLRDVEHHGSLAEAAEFGHVHEIFELLEVHVPETVHPRSPEPCMLNPRPYCFWIPAFSITFRHLSISDFSRADISSGVLALASIPSSSSRFFTSGSARISCSA